MCLNGYDRRTDLGLKSVRGIPWVAFAVIGEAKWLRVCAWSMDSGVAPAKVFFRLVVASDERRRPGNIERSIAAQLVSSS